MNVYVLLFHTLIGPQIVYFQKNVYSISKSLVFVLSLIYMGVMKGKPAFNSGSIHSFFGSTQLNLLLLCTDSPDERQYTFFENNTWIRTL